MWCDCCPSRMRFPATILCETRLKPLWQAWVHTEAVWDTACDSDRNSTAFLFKSHGILISAVWAHSICMGLNRNAKVSVLSTGTFAVQILVQMLSVGTDTGISATLVWWIAALPEKRAKVPGFLIKLAQSLSTLSYSLFSELRRTSQKFTVNSFWSAHLDPELSLVFPSSFSLYVWLCSLFSRLIIWDGLSWRIW